MTASLLTRSGQTSGVMSGDDMQFPPKLLLVLKYANLDQEKIYRALTQYAERIWTIVTELRIFLNNDNGNDNDDG